MPRRDVIVIGGSAGGIEACCQIVRGLPRDLPAAIFIVQHIGPASKLAEVLGRCGEFEVTPAVDGAAIKPKRAYVAPGDRHLLFDDGHIKLSRGPRENGQRPSVDALFRSASSLYRSRVIAVVLTGALHDGAAGVLAIKQRGGVVIVQDPQTALFPSMPENALRAVRADHCVPSSAIAALLVQLVNEPKTMGRHKARVKPPTNSKTRNGQRFHAAPFVCPDCSGPLFHDAQGPRGQLKCLVGHSFAPESLSEAHRDALERAVLTTMRLLQERAAVQKHLASTQSGSGNGRAQERFREGAAAADKDAALLREILEKI